MCICLKRPSPNDNKCSFSHNTFTVYFCSLFKIYSSSIQTYRQEITSGNKSVSYKNVPLGN